MSDRSALRFLCRNNLRLAGRCCLRRLGKRLGSKRVPVNRVRIVIVVSCVANGRHIQPSFACLRAGKLFCPLGKEFAITLREADGFCDGANVAATFLKLTGFFPVAIAVVVVIG